MNRTFAYRLFHEPHELTGLSTQKHKGLFYPVEILVFFAVFLVTQFITFIPAFVVGLVMYMMQGEESMSRLQSFFSDATSAMVFSLFLTVVPLLLVILFCRLIQKRPVQSMGYRGRDFVVQYGKGLLVGLVMFSLVIALGVIMGGFRFAGVASSINPLLLLLFFLGFMIQGMEEEAVCRGYFMISVSRRSPMWLAVITNSVVFALGHIVNNGIGVFPIVNLVIFGVFASLYMLRTGNIWGVGAIHTIWNYVQANVYGLPVSGITNLPTLFRFEQTEKVVISGGAFGPEGGLPVTIVYLVGIMLVLFLPERKRSGDLIVSGN